MSRILVNYYDILGVSIQAGSTEIKTAFRRLAKVYHPDKNPDDRETFNLILRAYETLSNPRLRSVYDQRLRYQDKGAAAPQTKGKNWRFDEREIKRRKYYEEHIKKYAKTQAAYEESDPKKSYNEYKYILFATPLAVALFLLIVNLAAPAKVKHPMNQVAAPVNTETSENKKIDPEEGPYTLFFGGAKFDTRKDAVFNITNGSGSDLIICLFGEGGFIRSKYIQQGASAELNFLPGNEITLRYSTGSDFDPNKVNKESDVLGAFQSGTIFYKSPEIYAVVRRYELTLQAGTNPGFVPVSEKEFFKPE